MTPGDTTLLSTPGRDRARWVFLFFWPGLLIYRSGVRLRIVKPACSPMDAVRVLVVCAWFHGIIAVVIALLRQDLIFWIFGALEIFLGVLLLRVAGKSIG